MSTTDQKPARGVLDPDWESALERGQAEAGEAGGLEADLGYVHMLRHARSPEELGDERLGQIWSEIQAEVAPAAWWRRKWWLWATPVATAAAVFALIIFPPADSEAPAGAVARTEAPAAAFSNEDAGLDDAQADKSTAEVAAMRLEETEEESVDSLAAEPAPADEGARARKAAPRTGPAAALEKQFAMLAPTGREGLVASVEHSRGELRRDLIGHAKRGGR